MLYYRVVVDNIPNLYVFNKWKKENGEMKRSSLNFASGEWPLFLFCLSVSSAAIVLINPACLAVVVDSRFPSSLPLRFMLETTISELRTKRKGWRGEDEPRV